MENIEIIEQTEEEAKEQAAKYIDPDAAAEAKYKWDEDFQRELMGLLLNDKAFLLEGMALIRPNYFVNDVHKTVCEILFKHFEKYKSLPNRIQLNNELRAKIGDRPDEIRVFFIGELNTILDRYVPGIESREYYQDKITNFAKAQALKVAFHKSLELVKKDPESDVTWSKVHESLREALTVERNFQIGEEYFLGVDERYKRMKQLIEKGETFTSGFASIDSNLMSGGLKRGEIGAWMGLSGTGKSLMLVGTAIANMNKGKRVLYITCEMDQDAVSSRFDAQIANLTVTADKIMNTDKGVSINNLLQKEDIVKGALKEYIDIIGEEDPRLLVVKQFPGGTMGMPEFRAYFAQICLRGFRPDLVIVDYIGEMKDYPDMPIHDSRFKIVRDLRGFGVEENVCVFTAIQSNRGAKEVIREGFLIDEENMGDSFAQTKPLDALWTINQTFDEKRSKVARVYVAKHRDGDSRFEFYVQFDARTLSFTEVHKDNYNKTIKDFRLHKPETVSDQMSDDAKARAMIENKHSSPGSPPTNEPPMAKFAEEDVPEPEVAPKP